MSGCSCIFWKVTLWLLNGRSLYGSRLHWTLFTIWREANQNAYFHINVLKIFRVLAELFVIYNFQSIFSPRLFDFTDLIDFWSPIGADDFLDYIFIIENVLMWQVSFLTNIFSFEKAKVSFFDFWKSFGLHDWIII